MDYQAVFTVKDAARVIEREEKQLARLQAIEQALLKGPCLLEDLAKAAGLAPDDAKQAVISARSAQYVNIEAFRRLVDETPLAPEAARLFTEPKDPLLTQPPETEP